MGIETIEGHAGPGVVSSRLISQVVRTDRPLDGGWGYDPEPELVATEVPATAGKTVRFPAWREGDPAATEAAANVALVDRVVSSAMAETARKLVSQGVSYAGEVPAIPDRPGADFKPFPTLP